MALPVINGFLCSNDRTQIGVKTFTVPGTSVRVALRSDVAPLLLEFMRWWHVTVEPIDKAPIDDWGYAARSVRGSTSPSFHWAGIAVDINALRHALGRKGTVPVGLRGAITAKAASLGLRWGGDYSGRVDEMHSEVIVTLPRALLLVRALQSPAGSAPPPAPAPPAGGRPVLRLGSRSAAVTVAQDTLNRKGFAVGKADGIYGVGTQRGVQAFQRANGLAADGVVGAVTWARLLAPAPPPVAPVTPVKGRWPTIRRGSKGSAVSTLQRFLGLTADGDFGPATESAVKRYQGMKGLTPDGIAGPAVWGATGL